MIHNYGMLIPLTNQETQRQTVAEVATIIKPQGRRRQSTAKEIGLVFALVNVYTVLMNMFFILMY